MSARNIYEALRDNPDDFYVKIGVYIEVYFPVSEGGWLLLHISDWVGGPTFMYKLKDINRTYDREEAGQLSGWYAWKIKRLINKIAKPLIKERNEEKKRQLALTSLSLTMKLGAYSDKKTREADLRDSEE